MIKPHVVRVNVREKICKDAQNRKDQAHTTLCDKYFIPISIFNLNTALLWVFSTVTVSLFNVRGTRFRRIIELVITNGH